MNTVGLHDMNTVGLHDMNTVGLHDLNTVGLHDLNTVGLDDLNTVGLHDTGAVTCRWAARWCYDLASSGEAEVRHARVGSLAHKQSGRLGL